MEKAKRIEAEFQLPEAIIHHIQSFFNGNEAAQTTILSRSWYQAWLTRPNLDFDQKHFLNKSFDFWDFAIKTVERYEKLNLKIHSLRLWIYAEHSLVNNLIIKALKMGATSLDFKIYKPTNFSLPHQVFGFENLTTLSVGGCNIGADNGTLISCSRLKSLALEQVYPQGTIIWEIISSCPFIENFSLNSCESIEFGKQNVADDFDGPILVSELCNLKRLYLSRVLIHYLFFDDFSSKFPMLKDLVIDKCEGCTDIEISSPSLECIDFTSSYGRPITRVEFDVPRMREFTFSGTSIPPLLLFETTPTSVWKSCITIERETALSATWFLALSRLLKKLSSSFITLHLDVWSEKPSRCTGELRGVRDKPEVDDLRINGPYSTFPAFYYSLFKYCRPIIINHFWIPRGLQKQDDSMEFVMKRKMRQVCLDSCIAYQSMSERDLKKVKIDFWIDFDSECPIGRSLDATSTSLGVVDDEHEILFYLEWEEEV